MGFETTIAADERPKTYALDRAATGIEPYMRYIFISIRYLPNILDDNYRLLEYDVVFICKALPSL